MIANISDNYIIHQNLFICLQLFIFYLLAKRRASLFSIALMRINYERYFIENFD